MKTFNNLIVLQLAMNFANLFIFPFMFMWSIGPIFPSSMVKLRFKSVPTVIPGIAKHSRRHQGPPLRRNLMFECKFIVSSLYYLLYYHCLYHQYCCITWSRCMCNMCVAMCLVDLVLSCLATACGAMVPGPAIRRAVPYLSPYHALASSRRCQWFYFKFGQDEKHVLIYNDVAHFECKFIVNFFL